MAPPPEFSLLASAGKDALVATLLARFDAMEERIAALEKENAELRRENAALREKLKLPPKTPDNSGPPPSQGHKRSGEPASKPKGEPHAGARRPLPSSDAQA